MTKSETNKKIQELIFQGISEGYDISHLDRINDDVLLFFYDLKDFKNWDGLFVKNDPSKITKEDIVKSILKTDHVSFNKIQCLEWCIEKGLALKPLLDVNYDDVCFYTIYCGLLAGVDEEKFENNGEALSLNIIHDIIKANNAKDIAIK